MPILFMLATSNYQPGHLDRKSLKRPDSFAQAVSGFFSRLFGHINAFIGLIIGLFLIGVAIAYWMNHRDHTNQLAQNALHLAEQAYAAESKTLLSEPAQALKNKPASKKGRESDSVSVEYKKLDVETVFPETIKKYTDLDREFRKTRAGFDARLKLGNLYFNHGDPGKALTWFQKAVETSPRAFEKIFALSSVGYVQENLGKFAEALKAYQSALDIGEVTLRADLLLSLARCNEATHEFAKARSLYDQVLVEFPNSEYSQTAELFKSQLPAQ